MQYATPHELYVSPQNTFVAGFIGEMNFISDCTGRDPDSIFFGQYILPLKPGRAVNYQGHPVIVAIRPEDNRVIRDESADFNILKTKVERIEFRGSLYTLRLRVLHQAGGGDRPAPEHGFAGRSDGIVEYSYPNGTTDSFTPGKAAPFQSPTISLIEVPGFR